MAGRVLAPVLLVVLRSAVWRLVVLGCSLWPDVWAGCAVPRSDYAPQRPGIELSGLLVLGWGVDTRETRDLLFDYFISKIFVGPDSMTIVSWFFNGGPEINHEDLVEAKKTGEALNTEDHLLMMVERRVV